MYEDDMIMWYEGNVWINEEVKDKKIIVEDEIMKVMYDDTKK